MRLVLVRQQNQRQYKILNGKQQKYRTISLKDFDTKIPNTILTN